MIQWLFDENGSRGFLSLMQKIWKKKQEHDITGDQQRYLNMIN